MSIQGGYFKQVFSFLGILVIVVSLLASIGCSINKTIPYLGVTLVQYQLGKEPVDTSFIDPVQDAARISDTYTNPGKTYITNFHGEGSVSHLIELHAGDRPDVVQKISVGTEASETSVLLNLKETISSLSAIVSVTSDLPGESLLVSTYDSSSNGILVKGFAPSSTRIVTIEYKPLYHFVIYVSLPDQYNGDSDTGIMYFAPPTSITSNSIDIYCKQRDTVFIMVTLEMSKGISVTNKNWEFWIRYSQVSSDTIQKVTAWRWLVAMQ